MIHEIFLTVLKMNCSASIVAILLLATKFILRKIGCPGRIVFLLWLVIAFRLICPVVPTAELSPFNILKEFEYTEMKMAERNISNSYRSIYYPNSNKNSADVESGYPKEESQQRSWGTWLSGVWITGGTGMLISGLISYCRIKRRLRYAVKLRDNIYVSDKISTSFVFGMIHPKIYLSDSADKNDYDYIIIHEQTHIKRFDHLSKIVAYVILSIHWFNPLNWLLFKLFSNEMELSCDEIVLGRIGFENKMHYIESILRSATNTKKTAFYTAYFSTNPLRKRIYNVIKSKRCPKFFKIVSIFLCVLIAVAFSTNATCLYNDSLELIEVRFKSEADKIKERDEGQPRIDIDDIKDDKAEKNLVTVPAEIEATPLPSYESEEIKTSSETVIKSTTVAEELYEGFELLELNGISIQNIQQELLSRGSVSEKSTDLKESFNVREYSYEDNLDYKIEDIKCDENGNISLYFELNSESVTEVKFYDSETGENVCNYHVLTNDKNVYTFLGFDKNKSYDIEVIGNTQSEWMIEGRYIIY